MASSGFVGFIVLGLVKAYFGFYLEGFEVLRAFSTQE